MIVELDVGNSRIKWRQLENRSGTQPEIVTAADLNTLLTALAQIATPAEARMSCVRGPEVEQALAQWMQEHWTLPLQIARVTPSCGGVRNQYADPARLGIDRWLAMLAAYQRVAGACVIIDSGTAFTIDVLDHSGLHLGGYIVPGLQLMRTSLEQNTRIRLSPPNGPESLTLGNATDSAVRNGTLAAQVSLIDRVVREARAKDSTTQVFFAGGDAALLAEQSIVQDFVLAPSLVLDGLAIACPGP